MDLTKRLANIKTTLTCGICQNRLKNVTIIDECCHRFCKKCIITKITEEKLHHCPICKLDLGCTPLQKIRKDHYVQGISDIIEKKRRNYYIEQRRKQQQLQLLGNESVAEKPIAVPFAEPPSSSRRSSIRKNNNNNKKKEEEEESSKQNDVVVGRRGGRRRKPADSVAVDAKKPAAEPSKERMTDDRTQIIQLPETPLNSPAEENGGAADTASKGKTIAFYDDDDKNNNCNNGVLYVGEQQLVEPLSSAANPIWFCLLPSEEQKLPAIPSPYIKVKNVDMPVSSIKAYIAQKLDLYSKDEVQVELSVMGEGIVVRDEMTVKQLLGLWCEAMPKGESKVLVGSSAKDFIMTLTYKFV